MSKTVNIIGPGRLGGQIAVQVLQAGAGRVLLCGPDYEKSCGIAADLNEAFPAASVVPVRDYQPDENPDFTFFTFSRLKWRPDIDVNDRIIDGIENIRIIDQLFSRVDPGTLGTVIILSNPVDVLSTYCRQQYGMTDVFGFGISLDDMRFTNTARMLLPRIGDAAISCIGEHGEHCVPVLSGLSGWKEFGNDQLYQRLRRVTFERTRLIISNYGIPFYSPQKALQDLVKLLLVRGMGRIGMSVFVEDVIQGKGVSLGMPMIVANGRFAGIETPVISETERNMLTRAGESVIHQLELLMRGRKTTAS